MERIGSDTRAYHSLTTSFVWDVPYVQQAHTLIRTLIKVENDSRTQHYAKALPLVRGPFVWKGWKEARARLPHSYYRGAISCWVSERE